MFQAHDGYLKRIELFASQPDQNPRDASSKSSGVGAPDDIGLVIAAEANKVPVGLADPAIQCVPVEILDHPPAGQKRFALQREIRRQEGAFTDKYHA